MSKDTGGPAFPCHPGIENPVYDGMSLRDYFAASFVTSGHVFTCLSLGDTPEQVAAQAYALADAMLKAREA